MLVLWIVAALGFAVAEVVTLALFAAFLALAAAGAAVAAGLGGGPLVQGGVFLVLAVLGIVVARPPLMRYLQARRAGPTVSGAQELVGAAALVVEAAPGEPPGRAHVQVMGERWPAATADGSPLRPGDEVRVEAISGATLIVALRVKKET